MLCLGWKPTKTEYLGENNFPVGTWVLETRVHTGNFFFPDALFRPRAYKNRALGTKKISQSALFRPRAYKNRAFGGKKNRLEFLLGKFFFPDALFRPRAYKNRASEKFFFLWHCWNYYFVSLCIFVSIIFYYSHTLLISSLSLSLSQVSFHSSFGLHNFFLTSSLSFFSKMYVCFDNVKIIISLFVRCTFFFSHTRARAHAHTHTHTHTHIYMYRF